MVKKLMAPFLQNSSNVYAENRLLKMGVGAMLLFGLFNAVAIQRLENHIQTHIIPVGTATSFVLTGDSANDEYLMAMARYVIHMVGDVTPANARGQYYELLKLWDSSTYSKYKDQFDKMLRSLESYPSVSYQIIWDSSEGVKLGKGTMRKRVTKRKMVGDTVVGKTVLDYEIQYKIEHGAFKILNISEIGGDQI